ncbi:tRNA (adenosine(37)-N6)-threonylcarbamoyltransferase complex ATPase subunit type 1 TsaE [Mycoplasma enhydrae]|uniref:tRNA (adenosine(37)-N6)-threonylcarbamoyltransferase complex ATPase subunit type 1 TsaE n=1 Tax=Mycoplasma enhydrae TaxID=2499220 RepID=UPI0021E860C5|nr:tRNA (adenosine(37)-N6)-threonylcarbamoyltransferase complex ATPase subunit type 1 TsaE [Mycoplasma enhydrae]MCV3753659.1 tRNA (adenosine(37)-N6)-threonylcarbamoyltransferase complex ATPase subunit type 1 TsaE [Mycoplasma enhydrae]
MLKKLYFKENQPLDQLVEYILSFRNLEALLLSGELGAGKTTLTSQIAKKLNETKQVVSPTFNTILIYDKIVHIDAYKLKGDLFAFEEYFDNKLVVVEWYENIKHNFKNYIKVNVTLEQKNNEIYHVFEIIESTVKKGLFIETSLEDFFVAIVENNQVIDYKIIKSLIKKTDKFFEVIDDTIAKNNLDINMMDEIYTTIGPGSFTGARLGFSYGRTNTQIQPLIANNDISLKLIPTYELFFIQNNKKEVFIKANKYKAYKVSKKNKNINIDIVDISSKIDVFDYRKFIKNPKPYLESFKEPKDLLEAELVYASDPQIGGQ